MSDDIVTRLRGLACRVCAAEPCMAHREAADEIERLRTENAELRKSWSTTIGQHVDPAMDAALAAHDALRGPT